MFRSFRKLWMVLGVLMLLSPLGLIATGTAFGEWGLDELIGEVGFVPTGLKKMSHLWSYVPMEGYSIRGFSDTFNQSSLGYIGSALVGVMLVVLIISFFYRIAKE